MRGLSNSWPSSTACEKTSHRTALPDSMPNARLYGRRLLSSRYHAMQRWKSNWGTFRCHSRGGTRALPKSIMAWPWKDICSRAKKAWAKGLSTICVNWPFIACRTDYSLLEELCGSRVYDLQTTGTSPQKGRRGMRGIRGMRWHEESSPASLTASAPDSIATSNHPNRDSTSSCCILGWQVIVIACLVLFFEFFGQFWTQVRIQVWEYWIGSSHATHTHQRSSEYH